jgi:hypothetical protein
MKTAVEMTGHGRRGKPNAGFPPAPTALGNRGAIPTFPPSPRRSGKWKTKNRFPHFPLPRVALFDQIQKGGLAAELRSSSRLIVRLENAQPSIFSIPQINDICPSLPRRANAAPLQ